MEQSAALTSTKSLKTARLVKSQRKRKSMLYSQMDKHVYLVFSGQ